MKRLIYSAVVLSAVSIASAARADESYQSTCYLYPVTSGRAASIALDNGKGYEKCSAYESRSVTTSSSTVQTAPSVAATEQSTTTQSVTPAPTPAPAPAPAASETQPETTQTPVRALW